MIYQEARVSLISVIGQVGPKGIIYRGDLNSAGHQIFPGQR